MDEYSVEIIVPCFNEEQCIEPLFAELKHVLSGEYGIPFSVFFIDDGSGDRTLDAIRKLAEREGSGRVRYISFSRNFGKEAAIYAGFEKCRGDYVVLMDADLQHPPELIPQMLESVRGKGHDCCRARRASRKGEPVIRSLFSKGFYRFISKVTEIDFVSGASDFCLMTRQMAEVIASMGERERFTKGMISWVGFDTDYIEYENRERIAGITKWSFFGLIGYAWSGFVSFATTPLRAVVYIGMAIVAMDFLFAIYFFVNEWNGAGERTGYATIVMLILFFGGLIVALLGIIGEYLARIYMEEKKRPIYIEKENNLA